MIVRHGTHFAFNSTRNMILKIKIKRKKTRKIKKISLALSRKKEKKEFFYFNCILVFATQYFHPPLYDLMLPSKHIF